MPLHGMYHQQIQEVDVIKKSDHWLKKTCLRDSTEVNLSIRFTEAEIYHSKKNTQVALKMLRRKFSKL